MNSPATRSGPKTPKPDWRPTQPSASGLPDAKNRRGSSFDNTATLLNARTPNGHHGGVRPLATDGAQYRFFALRHGRRPFPDPVRPLPARKGPAWPLPSPSTPPAFRGPTNPGRAPDCAGPSHLRAPTSALFTREGTFNAGTARNWPSSPLSALRLNRADAGRRFPRPLRVGAMMASAVFRARRHLRHARRLPRLRQRSPPRLASAFFLTSSYNTRPGPDGQTTLVAVTPEGLCSPRATR